MRILTWTKSTYKEKVLGIHGVIVTESVLAQINCFPGLFCGFLFVSFVK